MITHSTPTGSDPTDDDTDRRKRLAAVRRRQIMLVVEEWGPGYHHVTGNGLRYVAEIVDATPAERDWLRALLDAHPELLAPPAVTRNPTQWRDHRRAQGAAALNAAGVAYDSGDSEAAHDHLDEALALGAVSTAQWVELRHVVATAPAVPR